MIVGDPDPAGVRTAREHPLRDRLYFFATNRVGVPVIGEDCGDAAHRFVSVTAPNDALHKAVIPSVTSARSTVDALMTRPSPGLRPPSPRFAGRGDSTRSFSPLAG